MDKMTDLIDATFGHKVRVRACGILVKESAILLIKHLGVGEKGYLWAPPGGGVEFGERINQTLEREFLEECNIKIEVGEFLFINEFITPPLHAIELFFKVEHRSGDIHLGNDPEVGLNTIAAYKFFSAHDLSRLKPSEFHQAVLQYDLTKT